MCGIFGIVSNKVIPFDRRMFCTLGINNDSRGGDSCGIFIDGVTEYGVDEQKYFINFMTKSNLLKTVRKCKCAIGHDRKASVGDISLETAQPVVFKNEAGNIDFVVIHNGTIHNYLDLADKYIPNIDCTDMTDSQVMATIFYNAGYDCLAEYQGGAVFFIVDYRSGEPHYYAWKGESKKTAYARDNEDKEERPFYFTTHKDAIIFSSISTYLYIISPEVWTLNPNNLVEFVGNKIYTVQEYPRDKVDQSGYQYDKGRKKVYTYPTNAYGGSGNTTVGGRNSVYDEYDDDELSRWENYWMGYGSNYGNNSCKTGVDNKDKGSFRVVRAIDDTKDRTLVNIQYDDKEDLYTNDEKLCHGEYSVSNYGYGSGYSGNRNNPKHYFWCGVHLCNRDVYEFLVKMASTSRMSDKELFDRYSNLVHYFSGEPYKVTHLSKDLWVKCTSYYSHDTCRNDVIQKCFSGKKMTIKDGICVGIEATGYPKNYSAYKDRMKIFMPELDLGKLKTIYMP